MNIKILDYYMNWCKELGLTPTINGLIRMNRIAKDYVLK